MFNTDADFRWRMKRHWIGAQAFQGYITAAGIAAGAPVFVEITTSGIVGLNMLDAADEVGTFLPLPYDMDVSKHVYFRILWGLGGTVAATDDLDWIITYTSVRIGFMTSAAQVSDMTSATTLVLPATALDTTISTANGGVQDYESATADQLLWTGYGSIDPAGLNPLNDGLSLLVENNADTGAPTAVHFMGVEMSYTPRFLEGPDGMRTPAKRTRNVVGNTLVIDENIR